MNKKTIAIISLATVIATVATFLLAATPHDRGKNGLAVLRESAIPDSRWKLISIDAYRISLRVPSVSYIDQHRISGGYEYIRIQNYRFIDGSGLKPGMYWLEIFLFDHEAKRKIWDPCVKMVIQQTTSSIDGINIHRGYPRNISPDAGGYMRSLCAETVKFDIFIHGADGKRNTRRFQ